jgi:hypothetical protein
MPTGAAGIGQCKSANSIELRRRPGAGKYSSHKNNYKARGAADVRRDSAVASSEWLAGPVTKKQIASRKSAILSNFFCFNEFFQGELFEILANPVELWRLRSCFHTSIVAQADSIRF